MLFKYKILRLINNIIFKPVPVHFTKMNGKNLAENTGNYEHQYRQRKKKWVRYWGFCIIFEQII